MGSEWETYALEDCMEAIIDYRGKTPKKTDTGVPLITAKIVKNGSILPTQEYIAEADYDLWMRRGIPQAGDVLLTTEAPLGQVAQLHSSRVALAQRIIALRGKAGFLDNTFLKFLMQSALVQNQLRARATGTTVIGIKQKELRRIQLPIPPLPEQRAIAHILGTLDDKIELNRRMNATLEAIARALFKSWFVDFDPVWENIKRKGAETPWRQEAESRPGAPSLPEHILALFPDGFEESEVGEIPRGWGVGRLGDVAQNPRRGVQPEEIPPTTPYIGLQHMPRRCIALDIWGTADEVGSGKYRFQEGEILFGKLRPYFHKVGIAPIDGVCSTDILVIAPKTVDWYGYVLGVVSSKTFVDYTESHSSGTRMPRTNWKDMSRYLLVLPPLQLVQIYQQSVSPLYRQIQANIHQSRTLATLRDTLLPRLISGELRLPAAALELAAQAGVADAERFLAEAGA